MLQIHLRFHLLLLKTEEKLEYENFLIKKMVPYCGKAPRKYKEPEEFLIKGKPTTSKRALQFYPDIADKLWSDYQAGKSKDPPGMTLEEFQFKLVWKLYRCFKKNCFIRNTI